MPITRSQTAASPACAGRKRKAAETSKPPRQPKKAKKAKSADEQYLEQAIDEFDEQLRGYGPRSPRRKDLETYLKYIRRFKMPLDDDAHLPSSQKEARRLLTSDKALERPVFVRDGANWSLIDRDDSRRPIEQLFDFLHDAEEQVDCPDLPGNKKVKTMRLADVRERVLRAEDKPPQHPLNFRDLVNPMLDGGIPQFMQSSQCMLLHDMMRCQLNPGEVCGCESDEKTRRKCDQPTTRDAYLALQSAWQYWKGTVMLSEAGGITHPHFDKFSTGTWISCIEGEIGFGWLPDLTEEERVAWMGDDAEQKGRYVFKVLRPGDALYMPPGTVHFVFRRPGGGQTLGFAAQVLRRAETMSWLRHLHLELSHASEGDLQDDPYAEVVPQMLQGLCHLIQSAILEGKVDLYGDKAKLTDMLKLAEQIEALAQKLEMTP